MSGYEYHKDESGDLQLVDVDGDNVLMTVGADDTFAVCYSKSDDDTISATLLKHGSRDLVLNYHRASWRQYNEAARTSSDVNRALLHEIAQSLETLEIRVSDINPAVLEEINAAISITGRVLASKCASKK